MRNKVVLFISTVIFVVVFQSQITLFVIQPIGALPDGKTLVILRMNKTNFIDSADAMCEREMKGVSLLCRGMMIATIAKKGTVLIKLPYSELLYSISTDGKTYEG